MPPQSESTSSSAPAATLAAAPSPSCLITNESVPFGAIKPYFVVSPDSLSEEEVAKLRASWIMDDNEFSSEYNEVHLRADWAGSLSRDSWTFVPPPDALQSILRKLIFLKSGGKNSAWFSVYPKEKSYNYRFVPFDLQGAVITRIISGSGHNPNHAPVPTIYLPPYMDFPSVKSNAHPYFVIYEALAQFHSRARSDELTEEQLQIYSTLVHINSLWEELREFPSQEVAVKPSP
ncbi:hypothetical protein OF83DRAFT_1127836 [Amylostereum chailletii]|nr:hypothetical protein OF83DRAFT_1127836 [Amylostereum chailletii]